MMSQPSANPIANPNVAALNGVSDGVERLFDGQPIISPGECWWDNGVTFNSSAILVTDADLISGLTDRPASDFPDGVVALHYRARPRVDEGFLWTRSFVGLAVHTPELELIKRFDEPVLHPGVDEGDADYLGCEDPRVTFVDGKYRMVYCGSRQNPDKSWSGSLMQAESDDLIHWTKLGFMEGTGTPKPDSTRDGFDDRYFDNMGGLHGSTLTIPNKDGVYFPDRIHLPGDGDQLYLLHRPMMGRLHQFAIHIATSETPEGHFTDHGPIVRSRRDPRFKETWVGGGGTPIPLGDDRYLMIGHTGNYLEDGSRYYVLDSLLVDMKRFDPRGPERVLIGRLDGFMRPETPFEIHGPFPDSVGNVIFSCGNYVHKGWLYIVYGGGDSYTLGARVKLDDLISRTEAAGV